MKAIFDADLSKLNTFRLHSVASALVTFTTADDLRQILNDKSLPKPLKSIGSGSNLLLQPRFNGTILMSDDTSISFNNDGDNDVIVTAGAAVEMDALALACAQKELWGLENLSGIPGTAGAAPVQNVGAYGLEVGQIVANVRCFDTVTTSIIDFAPEDLAFAYRDSMLKRAAGRYIVLSTSLRLSRKPNPRLGYANLHTLLEEYPAQQLTPLIVRNRIIATRNSKLPAVDTIGSAGSFFKNPVVDRSVYQKITALHPEKNVPYYAVGDTQVKIPAAWLIDNAGCKSLKKGGAAIWQQQPLVIVNSDGTATAADIIELEQAVIQRVASRYGITLSPEVEHLGSAI
jgi:UDP-N-acetylmuramate dehydrogenase